MLRGRVESKDTFVVSRAGGDWKSMRAIKTVPLTTFRGLSAKVLPGTSPTETGKASRGHTPAQASCSRHRKSPDFQRDCQHGCAKGNRTVTSHPEWPSEGRSPSQRSQGHHDARSLLAALSHLLGPGDLSTPPSATRSNSVQWDLATSCLPRHRLPVFQQLLTCPHTCDDAASGPINAAPTCT